MIPEQMQIALATALLSALTTYLALVTKIRRDLEAQYDKDLRERRLKAYPALWALSEPLARFSPAREFCPDDARTLSQEMRKWYFREGLVMSMAAREAYFRLQGKLTAKTVAAAIPPLAFEVIEDLKKASSEMHNALCGDVGSRRPPMIGARSQHWWERAIGRPPPA
jgi:hypothetical protein